MLSPVHAPGITLELSRLPLRMDKKRQPLACRSCSPGPDVAGKTSPLCDVLRRPTGKATGNGYLDLGSVCHLLIGTYRFARDHGCVHPDMPLGRKHLRRNRDAPTGGMALKRSTSTLGRKSVQVKPHTFPSRILEGVTSKKALATGNLHLPATSNI
jgi:hypothetical protein